MAIWIIINVGLIYKNYPTTYHTPVSEDTRDKNGPSFFSLIPGCSGEVEDELKNNHLCLMVAIPPKPTYDSFLIILNEEQFSIRD
jgi:hypothetical protein